ncbi:hypothetical protein HPB48_013859 [Haemaphysalis longicornis]|uniref:Uncharacterized protein n=1 Tax=Haemaphysalis longicornis TaxID=44386 RepID=A0A9J6FUJ8_HAELO|nr:hypothetical protein HPB48_013859 [Haemaphysalis longicornis]
MFDCPVNTLVTSSTDAQSNTVKRVVQSAIARTYARIQRIAPALAVEPRTSHDVRRTDMVKSTTKANCLSSP